MSNSIKPVVRMAPSPTGNLHVGTARTALYNFLFAKQNGGKFIMRIEDTDKERSTKEYEDNIIDGFKWLQLEWDEMYKQSERTEIYSSELQKLLDKDLIYISKETPTEEGQREEVIRFRNPNKKITFHDEIREEVTFDTTELKDFVIARSMTEPLYHFAVVVDDFLSQITHVIRGEDHISNTPRQILIQEAIGAPRPIYAHLPLLLGKDRSKLSKRHGATSISEYRNKGYLPETMVNFLTFLGFNPGTEKEIYTLKELIEAFDLKRIQKGGAIFDEEKLKWMNKEHMKLLPEQELNSALQARLAEKLDMNCVVDKQTFLDSVFERIDVFSDVDELMNNGEFDYLKEQISYDKELLHWPKDKEKRTKQNLEKILEFLSQLGGWNKDSIKNALWSYAEEIGKGNVLWPLRYALTGKEKSPDPFTVASILGKEKTLERIQNAISLL